MKNARREQRDPAPSHRRQLRQSAHRIYDRRCAAPDLGKRLVSEGGLEPPRPIRALAPQASASAIPPLGRDDPWYPGSAHRPASRGPGRTMDHCTRSDDGPASGIQPPGKAMISTLRAELTSLSPSVRRSAILKRDLIHSPRREAGAIRPKTAECRTCLPRPNPARVEPIM